MYKSFNIANMLVNLESSLTSEYFTFKYLHKESLAN